MYPTHPDPTENAVNKSLRAKLKRTSNSRTQNVAASKKAKKFNFKGY